MQFENDSYTVATENITIAVESWIWISQEGYEYEETEAAAN